MLNNFLHEYLFHLNIDMFLIQCKGKINHNNDIDNSCNALTVDNNLFPKKINSSQVIDVGCCITTLDIFTCRCYTHFDVNKF